MKGYTKIKIMNSTNSKSMEDSDLLTSLEPTKTNICDTTDITTDDHTDQEKPEKKEKNNGSFVGLMQEEEDDDHHQAEEEDEEIFSMKLKRNSSVSSAYALHSAMKKAFSIRRSSSVSERYCRIHDKSVTSPSPTHDHDGDKDTKTRSMKRKNSRGRILKACKKLLGF